MKKRFFDYGSLVIGFGIGILIGILFAFKTPEPKPEPLPANMTKISDVPFISGGVYEMVYGGQGYIIVFNNGNVAITKE